MKKSEWSDKQLENLLRQMPNIKDHRDPRDIYQNISSKLNNEKRRSWLMPGVATVAAALVFLMIIPGIWSQQDSMQEMSLDKAAPEHLEQSPQQDSQGGAVEKKAADQLQDTHSLNKMDMIDLRTALYSNEVGNNQVLTYWVPDTQATFLVPISILSEQDENANWIDSFNKHMENLNEEAWGLSDYYPLKGDLSLDSPTTAIFNVAADHPYAQGSNNELGMVEILIRNLASNSQVEKIQFKTNGTLGISTGNDQFKEKQVVFTGKKAYFLYRPDADKMPLLVPSEDSFSDIKQAFEAMKQNLADKQRVKSIPETVQYELTQEGDQLTVNFLDGSVFADSDESLSLMVEAMMLTAKDFGIKAVKFNNMPVFELSGMDFSQVLEVPVAPNKR
ncbi:MULTISPECIES: GerMN domain-containing protein [unclassified Bacillus (in: firmicutes)]|uniref:GerMN domain-containing protein n=1 Tax=unclassified Bacillus (in: firmicutes) TaxID=185979 RepID=UPI0008F2059E|nr:MULTISPECIES: GerMN domain-containing protein [unclassified Bacillus (in: firmicutes)]SFA98076.1 hypothetical protein SAMN02799634_103313 [Bacillus sp. UNCCL13]SFQ80806.1 hypothetical protein SAMN04488577_1943 [Bacillus sp. cl95]